MPRRRARLALVTALAAGTVLALARPAAAATTLTVDAGYGQLHAPGRSFPVRVEVRVDRLVAGSVEVVSTLGDGRRTAVSLPVEVPGGSAKSFLLVVPPQVSFDGSAPRRQWRAGLAVRAALAVLLVAAAAGIALPRRGTGVATLFLVDASDTLGAAGREAAVEWVRRSASVRRPS